MKSTRFMQDPRKTTAFTVRIDIDLMMSLENEVRRQNRPSMNNLVQFIMSDFARRVQHRERTGELPPPLA